MNADASALEIAASVRAGNVKASALTQAALEGAAKDTLNCFTSILAARARGDATEVDQAIASRRDPGPLAGVPVAVKNLFDVAGETTLAGAKLRLDAPPAREDAFAVAQLKRAGAVLIGTLNMDEFAYGFTTENAHFGATRNPHDPERVAGGSSGGSAAAVAAGYCAASLGSDTNGSVRVPAALCGVWGIKPTYGRLSRRGVFPFVYSLDHVGAFARTADDLTAIYAALEGADPHDSAQAVSPPSPSVEARRIAILDGYFDELASPEARAAVKLVADALGAGARAALPGAAAARAAAFCLSAAEGGALHLPTLRRQSNEYDPATRDRLLAGAMAPASIAMRAQRVRRRFKAEAAALFERFDLLLAPATPFAAPRIGQRFVEIGGKQMLARASLGLLTQPLSFIGLPIVCAPVIQSGALPLGVQIIGPPWAEARVLDAARRLEQAGVCRAAKPSELAA